jgi:hypothetical protein
MITAEKKPPAKATQADKNVKPDVQISKHGSLFLFQPLSSAANEWIEENVGGDTSYFGSALAVESRYALDLAGGMKDDGLVLE